MVAESIKLLSEKRTKRQEVVQILIKLFFTMILANRIIDFWGYEIDYSCIDNYENAVKFAFSPLVLLLIIGVLIAYFVVFWLINVVSEIFIIFMSAFENTIILHPYYLKRAFLFNRYIIQSEGKVRFNKFEGREGIKFFYQNFKDMNYQNRIFKVTNIYFITIYIFFGISWYDHKFGAEVQLPEFLYNIIETIFYIIAFIIHPVFLYMVVLISTFIESLYSELLKNELSSDKLK